MGCERSPFAHTKCAPSQCTTKKLAFYASFALAVIGIAGCADGGGSDGQVVNAQPFEVQGSIVDGPVVGADIVVFDREGEVVYEGAGSDTAKYRFTIPENTLLPVRIRATGGRDLVTGRRLDFELIGVTTGVGDQVVNLAPLGTVVVKATQCRNNIIAPKGIHHSWVQVRNALGMGLVSSAGNPITASIDASLDPDLVLANEALGEVIRRTSQSLVAAGESVEMDEVLESVACDVAADGVLDTATLSNSDPRISATARAAEAAVSFEVLAGELKVDGQFANELIDDSLREVANSPIEESVDDVAVSDELLGQSVSSLLVMQTELVVGDMTEVALLMEDTGKEDVRGLVNGIVGSVKHDNLQQLAGSVAQASDADIEVLSIRMKQQKFTAKPKVAFDSQHRRVALGESTTLSWASSNSDVCIGDGGWSGELESAGTFQTQELEFDTEFVLRCAGMGGVVTQRLLIDVVGVDGEGYEDFEFDIAEDPTFAGIPNLGAGEQPRDDTGQTAEQEDTGTPDTGTPDAGTPDAGTPDAGTPDAGGSASGVSVVIQAQDQNVPHGALTTLSWSSSGSNRCVASGDWSGNKSANGSETVGPLTASSLFRLQCSGTDGSAAAITSVSLSDTVKLSWRAPQENVDGTVVTDLTGFRVYYGAQSRRYGTPLAIGDADATGTELVLDPGTYYVAVSAINSRGEESEFSNEKVFSVN